MLPKTERTYKILTVDDRAENLYVLSRFLNTLSNVELFEAASGDEALVLLLEHDFCVAIVDVQMPGMDGYELVELMRGNQKTAQLPVIFVSAILQDEYHHRKGYEVGAVDFMSKPFNHEILLSKVKIFIDIYEQRMQLQEWSNSLEGFVEERTEELARAYERLAKLDNAKNDFIQVASHELRTPLTLIGGYTSALLGEFKDNEMAVQMLVGINKGQERLLEVVNNMLYVSRIDTELLNLARQPVAIVDVLEIVQDAYRQALDEREISLNLEGLEALPLIQADPDLLPKVFNYLVGNAIKFTPDGGEIVVSGGAVEDEQKLEIRVADSGIGIETEYLDMIFEKFFQTGEVMLHSSGKTKFKGGGPGLGLFIARGIVQAHGGRVWAESPGFDEENCPGSIFYVQLPLALEI